MAEGGLSKEAFNKMIATMDEDGSGTVEQDEFINAYAKMYPKMGEAEVKKLWGEMDADGDGHLTVEELAQFFGFSWADGHANEMTDEDILKVLEMMAELAPPPAPSKAPEPKKEETMKSSTLQGRDLTLKQLHSDVSKNKEQSPEVLKMIKFLQACTMGDLKPKMNLPAGEEKEDAHSLLEEGVRVRFVDEVGEGPLHKLARLKPGADGFQGVFATLINHMKAEVKQLVEADAKIRKKDASHVPPPTTISSDVNYPNKTGKTPLFIAIEFKNTKMIEMLFGIGRDGPDLLMVNDQGWSMLHMAAHCNDVDIMGMILEKLTPARKMMMINLRDKSSRTPLHISTLVADDSDPKNVVKMLVDAGAKNNVTDTGGNTPSALAEKTGRRASKEMIEEATGTKPKQERRRSRDSRE